MHFFYVKKSKNGTSYNNKCQNSDNKWKSNEKKLPVR